MKLSVIAAVVASAGIAQVSATPIRIIISSPQPEGLDALNGARFGHPVPLVHSWKVAEGEDLRVAPMVPSGARMRRPCHGRMSRLRQKGVEISNAFRKALGLPLIETSPQRIHMSGLIHGGVLHVMSKPNPESNPEDFFWANGHGRLPVPTPVPVEPTLHRNHRLHHHGFRGRNGSFTARLHHSLMHLGRWEARAVAFVLGCGIGVLLRMFWVLAVVLYRTIKGQREDEHEYSHITIIEEYEETPVYTAPPTYIYPVDEKVAVKEDDASKAPVTTEESK